MAATHLLNGGEAGHKKPERNLIHQLPIPRESLTSGVTVFGDAVAVHNRVCSILRAIADAA